MKLPNVDPRALARDIYVDLVDKRLWPLALALVLALLAIPVLMSREAPALRPVQRVAAGPGGGSGGIEALVRAAPPESQARLRYALKDPFKQQGVPKLAKSIAAVSSPGAAGAAGLPADGGSAGSAAFAGPTGRAASAGASGAGGGSTSSLPSDDGGALPPLGGGPELPPLGDPGSEPAAPASNPIVRFGRENGPMRTVVPLEALPDLNHPVIILLGFKNGKAEFLVNSDARPQDDRVDCRPSRESCERAYLKPGASMRLTVGSGEGTEVYIVDVGQG